MFGGSRGDRCFPRRRPEVGLGASDGVTGCFGSTALLWRTLWQVVTANGGLGSVRGRGGGTQNPTASFSFSYLPSFLSDLSSHDRI